MGRILSVMFAPDGKTLAAASGDPTVKLWDMATGQVRVVLEVHTSPVNAVAFAPDGKTLASGRDDGMVKLWDATMGQARASLEVSHT